MKFDYGIILSSARHPVFEGDGDSSTGSGDSGKTGGDAAGSGGATGGDAGAGAGNGSGTGARWYGFHRKRSMRYWPLRSVSIRQINRT